MQRYGGLISLHILSRHVPKGGLFCLRRGRGLKHELRNILYYFATITYLYTFEKLHNCPLKRDSNLVQANRVKIAKITMSTSINISEIKFPIALTFTNNISTRVNIISLELESFRVAKKGITCHIKSDLIGRSIDIVTR